MRALAASCRRLPRAPMSRRSTGSIAAALREAGIGFADIDAVAATAGPGLIGGVIVGLTTAKAIAAAAGKPLVAVNHLEGHALTARLTDGLAFPYLLLLVSGGHSQFLAVEGVGNYRRLGSTIDDALGEAFDKAAKLLGLPYPGGPAVEAAARDGDAQTLRPAAAAHRQARCRFLLLRPEDRPSSRRRSDRPAVGQGCRRSRRLLPGRRRRGGFRARPQCNGALQRGASKRDGRGARTPSPRRGEGFAP